MHIVSRRYQHSYIPNLDEVFESLNEIECPKLERLFLKFINIDKFSVAPFEKFLKLNPQLVFVMIVIHNFTQSNIQKIRRTLNKFKTSPIQIFFATPDEEVYLRSKLPVPAIHKEEMIDEQSRVSTLDIFNGFI